MIIKINDNISDPVATKAVLVVICQGRLSKNETQYSYATTLVVNDIKLVVYADKTKGGQDKFEVYLDKYEDELNKGVKQ
jgi:hypothetical protein